MILTAHVNELPPADKGFRVLVTRKWPRGIPKTAVDWWVKDLGGSLELLKEFKKGKVTASGFVSRYMAETSEPGRRELVLELQRRVMNGTNLVIMCDGDSDKGSVRVALKEILEAT